ncbi:MAG: hypothetical protein V7K49_13730 [Nostoc sp.]
MKWCSQIIPCVLFGLELMMGVDDGDRFSRLHSKILLYSRQTSDDKNS